MTSNTSRTLPQYQVLIYWSAGMALLPMAQTVRELTRFAEQEARIRMWQAYHRGCAIILSTHLERAELYVEQFRNRGLNASIAPVT